MALDLPEDRNDAEVPEEGQDANVPRKPHPALTEWVMDKVNGWREQRDSNYQADWAKYYRIWRGKWDPALKLKQAERSKIITPATQSAVDQTVAEMAEAVFGRGVWFDLTDPPPNPPPPQFPPDTPPQVVQQAMAQVPDYVHIEEEIRDNLISDLQNSRFKDDVVETFYNSAIYGTGIAKRVLDTKLDGTKYICWKPVAAHEFVIDSAATTIDDALGCAHETILPHHMVTDKQLSGEYFSDEEVSSATGFGSTSLLQRSRLTDMLAIDPEDGVYFTEYHGKVPTELLFDTKGMSDENADLMSSDEGESGVDKEDEYTEAVVCIANGTTILSATPNDLKDRGFSAYQHHRSPNSFWGIGVVEKAFNSQSGLDGEVRARMDALALTTYPTVGVDATRMPRNLSMQVAPGKVYMTNGQPNEIIQPISFGGLSNSSFQQSGDLERYVGLATGANDPSSPINGNSTPTNQSMAQSAFIKRAKLTMQAVDVFLNEIVRKSITAYAVLNPDRYPKIPYFTVNSTMSIMAREFEQMQMTNLLAIVPQQGPYYAPILRGIIESYSGPSKDKILAAIDQASKPDPATQQYNAQMQQAQLATAIATQKKTEAEAAEVQTRAGLNQAKTQTESQKAPIEAMNARTQQMSAIVNAQKVGLGHRQLELQAAQAQLDHHHKSEDRNHDSLHQRVSNMIALKGLHDKAEQTAVASNDKASTASEATDSTHKLMDAVSKSHEKLAGSISELAKATKKTGPRKGKAKLPSGAEMTFEMD